MLCAPLAGIVSGCVSDVATGPTPMTRYTLEHDGLEREYFVFLPSSYGKGGKHPVAFFMHGYGGSATGTEAEVTNGLNRYAEEYGYVMVYPQGTWFMSDGSPDERWEVTSWNHISDGFDKGPGGAICTADAAISPCPPECGFCGKCGWASCNDDVGFLKKLFERVSTEFETDVDRESIDCLWPEGDHRWPGTPGFRGSNGYCISELQARSMPERTLCIEPDFGQDAWGSRLLFEFFDRQQGKQP